MILCVCVCVWFYTYPKRVAKRVMNIGSTVPLSQSHGYPLPRAIMLGSSIRLFLLRDICTHASKPRVTRSCFSNPYFVFQICKEVD